MTQSFEDELRSSLLPSPSLSLHGQTAWITGASAGIGLATTLRLLREGVHVTGVARRKERLEALQAFILSEPEIFTGTFTPLVADVCDPGFLSSLENQAHPAPDILIANAGLARGRDPVATSRAADIEEMLTTNVSAVFRIIRAFLTPMIVRRSPCTILGLGSIAGHTPYENGAVYCATKHALRAFFAALRQETCHLPLRVALVSPGLVETEFSLVRYSGDKEKADEVYSGLSTLSARDVAEVIHHILTRPAHVNIDDVILMPQAQGSVFKIARNTERS